MVDLTFDSTEFDNAISESGTVHESTADTDHNDSSNLKQGYPYDSLNVISPTPKAVWPLHEDSGSTAHDLSGNGNDGTVSGPTLGQTGILETTAYAFDGTDDYVDVALSSTRTTDAVSLTTWTNPDADGTNQNDFANVSFHWKDSGNDALTFIQVESDGTWDFGFRDSGGSLHEANSGISVSSGTWYFLALTWDGSTLRGYVDAVEEATNSVNATLSDGENWAVGARPSDQAQAYNGAIADARIYNSALSSSQIQTLYNVVDTRGDLTTDSKVA